MTGATSPPLWRDARFRLYWTGQSVSELGDRVSELALPLLAVTVLEARAIEVGALIAAIWLPNLAAVLVGTWVDRRASKRRLLLAANLVQAAAILSVPLAAATGSLSMTVLYGVAVVGGAGGVLYDSAYPSFFAHLVPRDQYVAADSLSGTRSASFIVGPPVAGVLIKLLSAPIALIIDGCSFLLSAVLISRVRVGEPAPARSPDERFRIRLRVGVAYLSHHPHLRASLGCSTTLNLCSFVIQAVVLVYASRTLGLGAAGIGAALGVGAIGALLGAVVAGRVARALGLGRTIAVGALLFPVPFALLPLCENASATYRIATLAAVELVSGLGVMLFDISNNSMRTAVTDDGMRSRVAGAYSTANYGIRPLAALLGGWTAERIGPGATMTTAALVGTVAVLWLVPSPVLRTRGIESLVPHPPPARHPG